MWNFFVFSAVVTTMRGMQSSIKGKKKRFTCPDFFTSETFAGCFRISIKSLIESCFSCYNESSSFLLSADTCHVAANKKCLIAQNKKNPKLVIFYFYILLNQNWSEQNLSHNRGLFFIWDWGHVFPPSVTEHKTANNSKRFKKKNHFQWSHSSEDRVYCYKSVLYSESVKWIYFSVKDNDDSSINHLHVSPNSLMLSDD